MGEWLNRKGGWQSMRWQLCAMGAVTTGLALWGTARAQETRPPEKPGLRCVGSAYFPVPEGTTSVPLPGGDFETDGKVPPRWVVGGGHVIAAADAPQGKHYVQFPARKGSIFITPRDIDLPGGQPYFFSLWLKCPEDHWTCIGFRSDEPLRTIGDHYPGIPGTNNQWKRVGYYVWMPPQAKGLHLQIQPHKDSPEGQFIAVDDVQLRTATAAEMSAAYQADRQALPLYDVTPRPEDGRNLALSVAKWEGRAGLPGKPFVIWAIGSSWTNFQGDGYPLIRAIREHFPQAPPIVYKKHAGSGTPWDYARGWVQQMVIPDQPDLVFTYTNGSPEGLDALLTLVRRHTTADVIVPSLHFFERSQLTDEEIERGLLNWDQVREVCRKHGAEFVENRRELAEYLKKNSLEPSALVGDPVHQNHHGFIRIWDNVTRHVAKPAQFSYDPATRERRIAIEPPARTDKEEVALTGLWSVAGGLVRAVEKDARLKAVFTGNRIDLIGRRGPGGGTVKVLLDGQPAEQAAVFFTTYLQPTPKSYPLKLQGPGPGDIAPHAVELGRNIVPQTWTITMTSENGDFQLEGSATGIDGQGHVTQPFTSRSGQIRLDPALWRHARAERRDDKGRVTETSFGNRAGDVFTFNVVRCATGEVGFRADQSAPFSVPLVQNLPNGRHTLELVAAGDGEVTIESLYVFEPPLAAPAIPAGGAEK